ncbi:MAG: hypothetical protein PUC39_05040 [Lachnospiraceae bacterium]|nr:hypothetical protein [Lachnospiraceae bacterium]
MQGYTLSERGKELIKWYYNRILATKIISILIGIVVALGLFWVLDDTMWYPLEFLIIWFCCFLGIFGSRTALVQLLQCNYTDLLNNKGEPRLFLEVFHGLKRLSHNKQMKPVDMLNVSAAYCNMGQYEDALNCLSEQYINYNALSLKLRVIYMNNKFVCYHEMGDWKMARNCFEQLKQEVERLQEKTHFARFVMWSEKIYTTCRIGVMDYEILTLEGRSYIPNILDTIREELEEKGCLVRRMYFLLHLGVKELALGHYEAAAQAFDTVVKQGGNLWYRELAKQNLRMIHDRDCGIELLQEGEAAQVRMLISQQTGTPISEEEIRNSIIYVLHEDRGEIAGVARITNNMELGEVIMSPEWDTGKNQFRLREEMKRRGYLK